MDNIFSDEKEAIRWAFEIHKNCDSMLHQRLSAFTAIQSFTIAAYTLLTNARFQPSFPTERIFYLEFGRYAIGAFGISIAVFGWMVTYPMLVRLQYLDENYLTKSDIYKKYLRDSIDEGVYKMLHNNKSRISFSVPNIWKNYRTIIPVWLPVAEIVLWVVLLANMTIAILLSK